MNPSLIEQLFEGTSPETLDTLPAYRLRQLSQAVFVDLISHWSEATVLPLSLRAELEKVWPLSWPENSYTSRDQRTTKSLLSLPDQAKVEAVLMRYPKRNSVCVSCQVGCAVGCSFCATGTLGLVRNLSVWEMVNQVLIFARFLKKTASSSDEHCVHGHG